MHKIIKSNLKMPHYVRAKLDFILRFFEKVALILKNEALKLQNLEQICQNLNIFSFLLKNLTYRFPLDKVRCFSVI